MEASLIEDSGAILNALAPFKYLFDIYMRLQLLKLLVRVQVWVLVVETHHVA